MSISKRAPVTFSFDEPPHILIVEARFYDEVSDLQLQGAKAVLDRCRATYDVCTVPGALEIPSAVLYAVRSLNFDAVRRRYDGFVALGCVIKGKTQHAEIVGEQSVRALEEVSLQNVLAVGNGILTVENLEQAVERADPARLDRGGAAAEACLRLIEVKHHFHLSSKRRWVAR